ncbi:uncharacterized protein BDZ99DRAFT_130636 [Mytilinidion resinicola]|uniref:Ankyrin n=1 Tax=Mytilinidion resinicola TaxID=574789 RepID=A0A6A6Z5T7_9PEZI|nr:uncharacterized protein BDZ99DRAFT_130636 [Mytilinidion resinicola]KAF2816188.1 hypothetical protein BDZ99DRAFT_130636 [Mytilinidion resinicola]
MTAVTNLIEACQWGSVADVTALLNAGADPNQNHSEALWRAIDDETYDILELLLARGAQPNIADPPYQMSKISKMTTEPSWVKRMYQNHGSPLQYACLLGDIRAVRLLLDAGADVNEAMGYFGSAMWIACWHGKMNAKMREVLQKMLSARGSKEPEQIEELQAPYQVRDVERLPTNIYMMQRVDSSNDDTEKEEAERVRRVQKLQKM